MSAIVPSERVAVTAADILAGRAVSSRTWAAIAGLTNCVLGRGANVVPAYSPNVTLTAATEYELRYWIQPRYQALERRWQFGVRGASAVSTVNVELPSGAAAQDITASTGRMHGAPQGLVEALGSQSATAADVTIALTPADADIVLESIGCWEMPRAALVADASDLGSDLAKFQQGQPISADSLAQIVAALGDNAKIGGRYSLLQWAVPCTAGGSTTTAFAASTASATFQPLFDLPVPVLNRKIGNANVTQASATFLAWVTGGGAGEVRFTDLTTGSSTAAPISVTSPTWSNAVTLDVDCEDLTAADGLQSAAFDTIQVEYRATSGTIYLASASVWDTEG